MNSLSKKNKKNSSKKGGKNSSLADFLHYMAVSASIGAILGASRLSDSEVLARRIEAELDRLRYEEAALVAARAMLVCIPTHTL